MDNLQLPLLCVVLSMTDLVFGQHYIRPIFVSARPFLYSRASPIASPYIHTNLFQDAKTVTQGIKLPSRLNVQISPISSPKLPQYPIQFVMHSSSNSKIGKTPPMLQMPKIISSLEMYPRPQMRVLQNVYPTSQVYQTPTMFSSQMDPRYRLFRQSHQLSNRSPNNPRAFTKGRRALKRDLNTNPVYAQMELKSKQRMMATLINYYKGHFGCVDAMTYIPQMMRFQMSRQFSRGCGPMANNLCTMVNMHKNPKALLNRNMFGQGNSAQLAKLFNSMDKYSSMGQNTMPMNPGMSKMFGGSNAQSLMRMLSGNTMGSPAGRGGMLGLEMGEVAEMREQLLPYQCQELGALPTAELGMCCPGPVELTSSEQMVINMGGGAK